MCNIFGVKKRFSAKSLTFMPKFDTYIGIYCGSMTLE